VSEPARILQVHAARASLAQEVARVILAGFDRHYCLFREASVRAKLLYERADWAAMGELARERGRIHAAGRAHEQRIAELAAQAPERAAHRRLRQPHLRRGARHAAVAEQRLEHRQQIEVGSAAHLAVSI